MTHKFFQLSLLILFWIVTLSALAQANSDNCMDAETIEIGDDGFATGVISSPETDLSSATVNIGEYFHPVQISSGNDKKSVWYKFSLPTTRGVKIELKQQGNAIPQGDAGFTTYKTSSCNNVTISEIESAKITPLNKFGNSYHPCLEPGDYLIQIGAKSSSNAAIYLEITLESAPSAYNYDLGKDAYDFEVIEARNQYIDYQVGCQSIDNNIENDCLPVPDKEMYTQSTWHTFTTDHHVDYIGIGFSTTQNDPNHRYDFRSGDLLVGYRLFKGNVKTALEGELDPVGNCEMLSYKGSIDNPSLFPRKDYVCSLQPNTSYSVQLLFHQDVEEEIRVFIREKGEGPGKGRIPLKSSIAPSNHLGVLLQSEVGVTTKFTDYLSCETRLSLAENTCGETNPLGSVSHEEQSYDLASWFTFELDKATNLNLKFLSPDNYKQGPPLLIRIFKKEATNDCNNVAISDLYKSYIAEYDESKSLPCLPEGHYTIQVLGQMDNTGEEETKGDYMYTNLGQPFPVEITSGFVNQFNKYSLSSAGKFDSVYFSATKLLPLKDTITYKTTPDVLGCLSTVLPQNLKSCRPDLSKAVYRVFNIGDADTDAIADSGMVTLSNLNTGNYSNPKLVYKLYKGNAEELAIAQSKFSFPDSLDGLEQISDCLTPEYESRNFCVVPGDHTLVGAGNDKQAGEKDAPHIQFKIIKTRFFQRTLAENMGDITHSTDTSSLPDYFSCYNNSDTIDGIAPCSKSTKLIYRQFYLDSAKKITLEVDGDFYGRLALFKGKADDTNIDLKVYADPESGKWACFSKKTSPECYPLPKGWYTVVAYGEGASYEDPNQEEGLIGKQNKINIRLYPAPPISKFNRPFKAHNSNNGNPLIWPDSGTAQYPLNTKSFQLETEYFTCALDTPFSSHPIEGCNKNYNRVAYYSFSLSQESFIRITGVELERFKVNLFAFDVRIDSARMLTEDPVQPCFTKPGFSGENYLQMCAMLPGDYTLVIFADERSLGKENGVTPVITVNKVDFSRFDHASKAYDFDTIPGTGDWYNGKIGDLNPLNANRAPSDDFFYCTTGASLSDPKAACGSEFNPNIYPYKKYSPLFNNDNSSTKNSKRNIWYTFVINGPGTVSVKLKTKTPEGKQVAFAIYQSDEDGSIPFSSLVNSGKVDSSEAQGLTFVGNNSDYYCNKADSISFTKSQCNGVSMVRYYVLVENETNDAQEAPPDFQVDLSIKFDAVPLIPVRYDHHSQANYIDRVPKVLPPYEESILDTGRFKGAAAGFLCATMDSTDQNCDGTKTIWYKFKTNTIGSLRLALEINGNEINYSPQSMILLKELLPGDSSKNGLDLMQTPENNCQELPTKWIGSTKWAEVCIHPGTYYIMLSDVHPITREPIGVENLNPLIWITEQKGDICSKPIDILLKGEGKGSAEVNTTCHSIGQDFGENGSNMGCLYGPENYKSTWFKISLSGTEKVDLTFKLAESTTALPSEIRYRVLYGDCSSMTAGPCNVDALTEFTLNCMAAGNYYVQVVSPLDAEGEIFLEVNSTITADQNCKPLDPLQPIANFTYEINCNEDSVTFINQSTLGESMAYEWDFADNGNSSSSIHPKHQYPFIKDLQTYPVKLKVLNKDNGKKDSVIVPVHIYPIPKKALGKDTTLCLGDTLKIDVSFPEADYLWGDGSNESFKKIFLPGEYWLEVKTAKCTIRDSLIVKVVPRPFLNIGNDTVICNNDAVVLNATVPGGSYKWSDGSENATYDAKTSGLYWVDVTLNGCVIRDSIMIMKNDISDIITGKDTTLCNNVSPIPLKWAPGYSWFGPGITPENTFDPKLAGIGTHQLFLKIENKYCSATAERIIKVLSTPTKPIINASSNYLCEGGDVSLSFLPTETNAFYWKNKGSIMDSISKNLIVHSTGPYTILLKNQCGFQESEPLSLLEKNRPASPQGIDGIRCGEGDLTLHATGSTGKYHWYSSVDGKADTNHSGNTFFVSALKNSTTFYVAATDEFCESMKIPVAATISPLPLVDAGQDQIIKEGTSITLQGTGRGKIQWSPSEAFNNSNILDPVVRPVTTSKYTLTIIDSLGCIASDTVMISIFYEVSIPNGITPNGDGINDIWNIKNIDDFPFCEVIIYNRWGSEIFKSHGYSMPWDGTSDGKLLPVGTYFYKIDLKNDRAPLVGPVSIIR